jgi:transglutaminase/protease-like cytokinesis protein 3
MIRHLVDLLLAGAKSDAEKVVRLHRFVIWRMSFYDDYFRASANSAALATRKGKLQKCLASVEDYDLDQPNISWSEKARQCGLDVPVEVPKVESSITLRVLFTGLWNCSGYATLFATLARAAGLPTKIETQVSTQPSFHFWNQVYINGGWRVVDTTFDDTMEDHGTYEDDSLMVLREEYLLVSPDGAASLDAKYSDPTDPTHKKWVDYEDLN